MDTTTLGETRRFTLTSGELEVAIAGSGPPVVFLHPLLASGLHWRKVVPVVAAAGFECITPTLPLGAHTVAMPQGADLGPPAVAGMVVELLDQLGHERVTLVGNDTGGALAQMITSTNPDVVERLVLTSCDAFEHFFPPLFRYLSWGVRVPGFAMGVGQALRVRTLRRTPITFGWLAKRVPHEAIDAYAQAFLGSAEIRRDVVAFVKGVDARLTCDAAEGLRRFPRPVLVAWAREDRVFSPRLARRLAEICPDATLTWIDDSYAFTPEDQPAELARLLIDFCRGAGGGS